MCCLVQEGEQQGVHAAACSLEQLLHLCRRYHKPVARCFRGQLSERLWRRRWFFVCVLVCLPLLLLALVVAAACHHLVDWCG